MIAASFLAVACAPPPAAMPPPENVTLDTRQAFGLGAGGGISTPTDSSFGQFLDYINATQFWWSYRIDDRHMVGFQGAAHYIHDATYNLLFGGGAFYRHGLRNDEKRYLNHKKSVRYMYGDKWNGYDKIKIRYFKIEL